jgi:hypothetical protein
MSQAPRSGSCCSALGFSETFVDIRQTNLEPISVPIAHVRKGKEVKLVISA